MVNVSPEETAKFDKIASRWWDETGEFQTLHHINPVRFKFITENCDLNNQEVLDIGCGGGLLTELIAKTGANTIGVDAAPHAIQVAKLHALETKVNIEYVEGTAEQLLEQYTEKFDVITCLELLEHVPSPADLIKTIYTLLKPGGICFFSTINRNLISFALGIVAAEHILRLLPKGTHEYAKFIKPHELKQWCDQAKLHTCAIKGIHYNPLLKSASLVPVPLINYIVAAKKN